MHVLPVSTPSLPAARLEIARSLLSEAQVVAARAVNDPSSTSSKLLTRGMQDAAAASTMLLEASPRSRFQDLIEASAHARQGADALGQAVTAFSQEVPAELAFANVKQHASEAFNAFERALEIIDND